MNKIFAHLYFCSGIEQCHGHPPVHITDVAVTQYLYRNSLKCNITNNVHYACTLVPMFCYNTININHEIMV